MQKAVVEAERSEQVKVKVTYKKVKELKAEDFKRLTGVHFEIFNQMVEIVKQAENLRKKSGRPPKLRIENQILMVLEYLREYRTFFQFRCYLGNKRVYSLPNYAKNRKYLNSSSLTEIARKKD